MKIYFAGAVRGVGATIEALATRIDQLSWFGRVLTEHMASPSTIDLGHRNDAAIHAHDQALLAQADVFVADCTVPSTGTGYMAARACARGLPVLCLYEAGARPSAMIGGAPGITTRFYDADFLPEVTRFFVEHGLRTRFPRIFLAGKPGCGKGTLGKRLAALTGVPHISTGEVLRALPADHPHARRIADDMAAGRLVPAEIMRDIVADRLGQPDCRSVGFILDGYPPSRDDLANLTALGIAPDVVIYIDVSDETSIARQASRAARSTDTAERARDRLAAFHDPRSWFFGRLVVRIDGEQTADEVFGIAQALLDDAFGGMRHTRSYFAIPPANPRETRTTRVHFHLDGKHTEHVRALARELHVRCPAVQGQLKIHPIRGLALGPQVARLPIYQRMPNFHSIAYPSRDEAFITGRLGDGDRDMMHQVLAVARDLGGTAELEEYLTDEWNALPPEPDYGEFAANRLPDIPRWELHHGFDLPKTDEVSPIALEGLAASTFDNGGWFLFANHRYWAYRSNELSNDPYDVVTARLRDQAATLRERFGCEVDSSLEIVHGIWVF